MGVIGWGKRYIEIGREREREVGPWYLERQGEIGERERERFMSIERERVRSRERGRELGVEREREVEDAVMSRESRRGIMERK